MKVTCKDGLIHLSLPLHIEKGLSELNMTGCKAVSTPLTPGLHLAPADDDDHQKFLDLKINYRSPIGRLNFIAGLARPKISFAVSSLAKYCERPGLSHWKEICHVWKYLSQTKNLSLTLGQRLISDRLVCFSDATWGNDPVTRISQSGFICTFKGSPLYWTSRRQKNITHSSTESECVALSSCHLEAQWLNQLIEKVYRTKHINLKTKSL